MKKILINKTQADAIVENFKTTGSLNRVNKQFGKDFNNSSISDSENRSKFNIRKPNTDVPKLDSRILNKRVVSEDRVNGHIDETVTSLLQNIYKTPHLLDKNIITSLQEEGVIEAKGGGFVISKRRFNNNAEVREYLSEFVNNLGGVDENYPLGAENNPSAPWNKKDPEIIKGVKPKHKKFTVLANNEEIAILKHYNGDLYVLDFENIDKNDFKDYANIKRHSRSQDDFDDYWDIDDVAIEGFVNNNTESLNVGVGVDDFQDYTKELVKIDSELASYLSNLYDKDINIVKNLGVTIDETPNDDDFDGLMSKFSDSLVSRVKPRPEGSRDEILKKLADIKNAEIERRKSDDEPEEYSGDVDEVTGAASSGAFVAPIGNEPIRKTIFEENDKLVEFDVPEWSLSYLINGDLSGLEDGDIEKVQQFISSVVNEYGNANFFMLDNNELGFKPYNDIDNLGSNVYRVGILNSKENIEEVDYNYASDEVAYTDERTYTQYVNIYNRLLNNEFKPTNKKEVEILKQLTINKFVRKKLIKNMVVWGFNDKGASRYFDEVNFINDFMGEREIDEATSAGMSSDGGSSGPYDANAFINIGRDGSFRKEPKKPKAHKSVQYSGGGFVKLDSCTRLNNNNKSLNGGCSAGASDGVVKVVKSKNSVIAPSL